MKMNEDDITVEDVYEYCAILQDDVSDCETKEEILTYLMCDCALAWIKNKMCEKEIGYRVSCIDNSRRFCWKDFETLESATLNKKQLQESGKYTDIKIEALIPV